MLYMTNPSSDLSVVHYVQNLMNIESMCGIVGVASRRPSSDKTWLSTASNSLAHRGPDDFGEWWSTCGRVGIAHRRLSIIDLSFSGTQPLHSTCGNYSIVFNGEIYNYAELRNRLSTDGYKFTTKTDTEVILAAYKAWGTSCVERLEGMFAFAIYDCHKELLFLARDRAGEKPLFYFIDSESIYFASELKALLANSSLPRNLSYESIDYYLAMGSVPGSNCILSGYKKLPPAQCIAFNLNTSNTRTWSYWSLPNLDIEKANRPSSHLVDDLDQLLDQSVKKCLSSDVPIGVLLSGGLDSSLITAYASRHISKVKTFSISFSGNKCDESEHSSLIAKHFGTNHTTIDAMPTSAELLPTLAYQFDEPMVDSSMIPTWLVSNLVRKHCTVALGGDGADELFGGYSHYSRILKIARISKYIPNFAQKYCSLFSEKFLPCGVRGRNYLKLLSIDYQRHLPMTVSLFNHSEREQLLDIGTGFSGSAETFHSNNIPSQGDLIQRATRLDFNRYLTDDILVKIDRASMLNSLELRSPFLDVNIIEFAFSSIPSQLKATTKNKKILLKLLASKILPSNFNYNRKQGFSIPMSSWLKQGPFRELIWDTLLSNDCFFNRKAVMRLMKNQDMGFANGERLFSLAIFELWRKSFKIST